ncbi:uncharacterized protein LOC127709590 [Mytilus californianus]|uniref:uncharacterized protein LOC127709590 n=1 Tax=Mytilus californianus TaxID=6549 RepID=UPI0022455D7F|nr:uncharacterized protein LOC127709590 [Mytilus californianus]
MCWAADSIIGKPRVYPKYGDIPGAWAQGQKDSKQFIEVEFDQEIYIQKIEIYETYHAGAVKTISARKPNNNYEVIWNTKSVTNMNRSRIFSPDLKRLSFLCKVLRINIDCTASKSWVEIDAIKITGTVPYPHNQTAPSPVINNQSVHNPNNVDQWVSRVVNYSSQYDDNSWPASCIAGEPRVYPKYGDISGSWAQGTLDANQFVEVEFAEKIFIEKIDIYETYHAGAVKKILAKRPNGEWCTVWETSRAICQNSSRIFSPSFQKLNFRCNALRINVDCTVSGSWVEIDAIKISGTKFNFDIPPAPNDITNDLAKLVNSSVFSDIQFDVNGVKFLAHRAILCVRSEYFRAMIHFEENGSRARGQGTTQPTAPPLPSEEVYQPEQMCNAPPSYDSVTQYQPEMPSGPVSGLVPGPAQYHNQQQTQAQSPIKLKDVEPGVFAVVLHYVYTNRIRPFCSPHVLPHVWRIADRFAMDGLKALAILQLNTSLTIDNVIDIYQNVIYGLPVSDNMKDVCELFMQNHMAEVVRHRTFMNLNKKLVAELTRKMVKTGK